VAMAPTRGDGAVSCRVAVGSVPRGASLCRGRKHVGEGLYFGPDV